MKVKINSEFIKSNRLNRAWSQEQLAHLAGLSLRTIHRVETNGTASLESIKAIASVLEVPLEQVMQCIKAEEKPVNSRLLRNGVIASLGALLFATLSIFVGNTALAEQVMLDVNVSVNDEILGEFGNILVVESKEEVFLFEEVAKILLVTTITENDGLFVSSEIFEFDGLDYELVSTPKALFQKEGGGAIQITTDNGNIFRISIASKIQ